MSCINNGGLEFRDVNIVVVNNFFNDLPAEILNEIFDNLKGLELYACQRVCKRFQEHIANSTLKFGMEIFEESIENLKISGVFIRVVGVTKSIAKILVDNRRLKELQNLIQREDIPDKEELLLAAVRLVAKEDVQQAIVMLKHAKALIKIRNLSADTQSLFNAEMAIAKAHISKGNVKAATNRDDCMLSYLNSLFREQLAIKLVKKGYIDEALEFVESPEVLSAAGTYLVENDRLEEAVVLYHKSKLSLTSFVDKFLFQGKFDLARQASQKIAIIAAQEGFEFKDPEEKIKYGFYKKMISIDAQKALEFFLTQENAEDCLQMILQEFILQGKTDQAKDVIGKLIELKPSLYASLDLEEVAWKAAIYESLLKDDLDTAVKIAANGKDFKWTSGVTSAIGRAYLYRACLYKDKEDLKVALHWAEESYSQDLRLKIAKAYALEEDFKSARNVFADKINSKDRSIALMELFIALTE